MLQAQMIEPIDEMEALSELAQETETEIERVDIVDGEEEEAPLRHPEDIVPSVSPSEPVAKEPSELESLRAEMTQMRQMLEEARAQAAPAAPPPGAVEKLKLFSDDEDAQSFTLSAEGLNELATRIANAAIQASIQYTQPIMQTEAQKAIAVYSYSKEFFDRYPELRDHGKMVQEISEGIENKNPSITPQQLFMDVAKAAYAKIGRDMPKAVVDKRKPGFTNALGSNPISTGVPLPKGVQQEVHDLLRHNRRL